MLVDALTHKERRFCEEYVIDGNAARSARDAGYAPDSASVQGQEIITRPHIQEYINFLQCEQAKRSKIDADYVLGSILEVLERAKGKIEVEQRQNGDDVETIMTEFKYDPKSALKAAELLGKHLALFTDVVDNRHTFTQMPDVKVCINGAEGEEMKALEFDIGGDPDNG